MEITQEFLTEISEGLHDGQLANLDAVVKARLAVTKRIEQVLTYASIQEGDEVMIGNGVRPKYLNGALAVVVGKHLEGSDPKVTVMLKRSVGRFSSHASVTCPISIIVPRKSS